LSIRQKVSDVLYLISNPGELPQESLHNGFNLLPEGSDNITFNSPLKRFSIRNMSDVSAATVTSTCVSTPSLAVGSRSLLTPPRAATTPLSNQRSFATPSPGEARTSMTKLSIKKIIAARAAAKKLNGNSQQSKRFLIPNTRADLMLELANSMTTIALAPGTPTTREGAPPNRRNRKQSTAMKNKPTVQSPSSPPNSSGTCGDFLSVSELFDELSKLTDDKVGAFPSNSTAIKEKELLLEVNNTKKEELLKLKETLLTYIKYNN